MDKGCNGGVPCSDGLVRARAHKYLRGWGSKTHVSFPVLCTDFENVGSNLCTALKPNLREVGGGGGGRGEEERKEAELKIHNSRSRYTASKIPIS